MGARRLHLACVEPRFPIASGGRGFVLWSRSERPRKQRLRQPREVEDLHRAQRQEGPEGNRGGVWLPTTCIPVTTLWTFLGRSRPPECGRPRSREERPSSGAPPSSRSYFIFTTNLRVSVGAPGSADSGGNVMELSKLPVIQIESRSAPLARRVATSVDDSWL
jgi:hypothetical protein